MHALTAGHPTLPLPSLVKVTNLENTRQLIVRVNDRGPSVKRRILTVSRKAAAYLGLLRKGTARVRITYLGPATLSGDDRREQRFAARFYEH